MAEKPLKTMHLLIYPSHPYLRHRRHPPPPSVSPFCPLAALTAADPEGQISHIGYLLLRVPDFFFFFIMVIILQLWHTCSAVKGPFIEFYFSWKEKHANFIEGDAPPHTIAEGDEKGVNGLA